MSLVIPTNDWREFQRPRGWQLSAIFLAALVFFVGGPVLFGIAVLTANNWALLAGMATVAASVIVVVRVLSSDRQTQDTRT
jgi:Kef-type K+ transport system membrane component KefB